MLDCTRQQTLEKAMLTRCAWPVWRRSQHTLNCFLTGGSQEFTESSSLFSQNITVVRVTFVVMVSIPWVSVRASSPQCFSSGIGY